MVDVSHGNSAKRPERQPEIAAEVAAEIAAGNNKIKGVMVESFLVAGNQAPGPLESLTYGQSITDGCIGWDTSVEVLDTLAASVRARRAATS